MAAPMVGVRESRRMIGEYVLSAQDYFKASKFEDAVSRNRYPIDIHLPTGRLPEERKLGPGEYHEIPYRLLIPVRVENLIVAAGLFQHLSKHTAR
jgi:hypothetical protein